MSCKEMCILFRPMPMVGLLLCTSFFVLLEHCNCYQRGICMILNAPLSSIIKLYLCNCGTMAQGTNSFECN